MKTLEDALLKVQEDPAKYLGKKSLKRLRNFIAGYVKSQFNETGSGPEWHWEFSRYVARKYDERASISAEWIIRRVSYSEADAFDRYFELLREFQGEERSGEQR